MLDKPTYHEKKLFEHIAEGDEEAFAVLFHLRTDSLYTYILKITKSDIWAEELVQDVWTQVWLNRRKLSTLEDPVSYLHRIARNRSLDWIRRNKLELKWLYYLQRNLHNDGADTTAQRIDHDQAQRLVQKAIHALPERRKRIIELKYRLGCSYEQIGAELQISKNTVRNQIVSALRSIRDHLRQHGDLLLYLICCCF
ncbi:MAG: sigma-70 family RNA polymerase sigma factor [Chitinophagaceae bacterium]|nr:sigma-70 family RNA polymerase sigma factor [Chitinophagaceae bacterium]